MLAIYRARGLPTLGRATHSHTRTMSTPNVLPMFSLAGKTAIVTGAGAGIGLAVAQALAEAGARVAFLYHTNPAAVARAAEAAAQYGVQCRPRPPRRGRAR